jgi:hypothetical protein
VIAGEDDRLGDVVGVRRADDRQRAAVDGEVEHAADLVIVRALRSDQPAEQPGAEGIQIIAAECGRR